MVFWASVLVFIISILTYSLYPRNDEYTLNTITDETNVVGFVNQHQAAKDYMTQMLQVSTLAKPNPLTTDNSIILLPAADLINLMPTGTSYEVFGDPDSLQITDLKRTAGSDDGYTSALMCHNTGAQDLTIDCVNADKQYILTYGLFPNWWSDNSFYQEAWRKSILRRTRGSAECGVLDSIGGHFVIDTTQKTTRIPAPVLKALQSDSIFGGNMASLVDNQGILMCISSFTNPYVINGDLVFHWDKINNDTIRHTDTSKVPLTGDWGSPTVGGTAQINGLTNPTGYTISGVVTFNNKTDETPKVLIKTTTDGTEENLAIFQRKKGAENVPGGYFKMGGVCAEVSSWAFSFAYVNEGGIKTLYINNQPKGYYSDASNQKTDANCTIAGNTTAEVDFGTLSVDTKGQTADGKSDHLLANLKIYKAVLFPADRTKNLKADKKRYGIQAN